MIAIIHTSPYNNQYKRLEILRENNLPKYPVNLICVDYIETDKLPHCIYNSEIYTYSNGQYYHEKYMSKQ